MIYIESNRLIIRDRTLEDIQDLHSVISNPTIMYYLSDIETKNITESMENLKISVSEANSKDRKLYYWGMYDKITAEHIGEIGLSTILDSNKGKLMGLGYFIKKEFWNKGYTTEASRTIINYAFNNLNCYKVESGCVKDNKASEKVMINLGMKKEADLKKHVLLRGKLYDRVEYGVLKEEWII